jgi:hypothetical protein
VVNTATTKFPLAYLSNIKLHERGDRRGVVTRDADGTPRLMELVWMNRDQWYFIASGSSLGEGTIFHLLTLKANGSGLKSVNVELNVPQPLAAEVHNATCAVLDQYNRDLQNTLMIERKLQTHDWATRVSVSIFAIILIDCWLVYSKILFNQSNKIEVQKTSISICRRNDRQLL